MIPGLGGLAHGVRQRFVASAERGSASLWPWPVAAGVLGVVAALVLSQWGPGPDSTIGRLAWPGDQEAATTMLQVVVASVMTATSVTFSLVVVALQVASQQFSPRLLRGFARDPFLKIVLAVLVATFSYSITLLRGGGDADGIPPFALLGTYLTALASLGALIGFISHMASSMRVDTMMRSVHADCRRGLDRFYLPYEARRDRVPAEAPADAVTLLCRESGFVRRVDVPTLVEDARQAGVAFELRVRPGDHVVANTPLATVWSVEEPVDVERATDLAHGGVELGYERTLEQDPSFGFRKLTDIAVKALSPGINDPVTAVHALGHMGDLLVRVTGRRLGPLRHDDEDGTTRLVTLDRDFRYYLDLTCGQIRRYGAHEPTVLVALLAVLRDVAVSARDDSQRQEIRRQAQLVLDALPSGDLLAEEVDDVEAVARRVEQVLHGDVVGAYHDRTGETRST